MEPTQKTRPIAVSSPLGKDVLLLRGMTALEQIGRPFEYELDLVSLDGQLKMEDLLGQSVTVRLAMENDKERHFNGIVSRFSQLGEVGRFVNYRATLRPWLWFLTRTADCRIFQNLTAPDIIKEVFRGHKFDDFDDALNESYRKWEFCVQYRETDFNFISRLMEQEGIYYFFKHAEGKHTLVLADGYSSHEKIPGYEKIPYYPPTDSNIREKEHIYGWTLSKDLQPGSYALNDFNFENPKGSLAVNAAIVREHAKADYEVYDYPGEYGETAEGDTYAKVRIEELQAGYERANAHANTRGMMVGGLFELTDYPREDQNREYLVLSAEHELNSDEFEPDSGAGAAPVYAVSLTAADAQQPYRLPRTTPKPVVQGPQTAMVVGKSGEEIWTDEYGRVKLQFHWDREGKSDENSSCWVRVAQLWAGKTWGGIHVPRIGQEVIVEFLEGDPDRPIVTGRVYNADSMPPYALPDNQTQSGIISRSSKGGGKDNYNEIRFEDKKGEELITIHAEKDQAIEVENDESHWVGHNRQKKVDKDEDVTIGNNRTENVAKEEKISIGANRTESVAKDEKISIGENRNETVGKDETLSVGGGQEVSVGKKRDVKVGNDDSLDVGANLAVSVGKNAGITVAKDYGLDAKKIAIEAGDEITVKTGKASIKMKKNGDITISGKKITIKGSGDVIVKGSNIKQN